MAMMVTINRSRRAQASVETAICLLVMAFVISAFIVFAEIFLGGMRPMHEAREDAGTSSQYRFSQPLDYGWQDGGSIEEYDTELNFFGEDLFPDGFRLSERAVMPAMGISR